MRHSYHEGEFTFAVPMVSVSHMKQPPARRLRPMQNQIPGNRSHRPLSLVMVTAAALILSACTGLNPEREAQIEQRDQQMLTAMEQCVASQEATAATLAAQAEQLVLQSEMIAALPTQLPEEQRLTGPTTSPICVVDKSSGRESDDKKLLVGALEQVWMPNLELELPARIDTGAETSSLDARNIEPFERNGKRWVRFEITHPQSKEPLVLERKRERVVSIVQANTPEPERRQVIKLGVVIGTVKQTAEFTLSNRSHLDYQVLIGRNVLQDVMVVDVSKKNIAPPVLPKNPAAGVD